MKMLLRKTNNSVTKPNLIDVCFILPGSLEAFTERGGGREKRLSQIANELSKDFKIAIIAPFFKNFRGKLEINRNLFLYEVYLPAVKNYPVRLHFENIANLATLLCFSLIAFMWILRFKRKGLKIIIASDIISGLLPAMVAKLVGIKVITYEGNMTPWANPYIIPIKHSFAQTIFRTFTLLTGRFLCNLSNMIIVNDGLIKAGMVRYGIEKSKIFVIRSPVNTTSFKPVQVKPEKENREEFVVGFIGRLTQEKGAPLLLEVCKNALDKLPKVRFMIFGDGPFRESLANLANIKYIGKVRHNKLSEALYYVDAIVTFQKTFGVAEIEALSCGKPIIASRLGEMPFLVESENIGLICKPDAISYVEAIRTLSGNKSLLKELSERSRIYAERKHSLSSIYNQWKYVIIDVLKR